MKKFLLLCWIFVFFVTGTALSQTPVSGEEDCEEATEKDPIVAMLDSLVSLNFMNRYTFAEAQKINPNAVYQYKTYSAEEYRERLKKLQSPIPLDYNQYVQNYIELYANRKAWITSRVLGLSQLYFPMFEQVLDRQGLPLEFKYLAIVESALNPVAVSPAGATGIWQFMYNTGKMYRLKITSYLDERRDPYKATVAACQYFKNMYAIYQDWLLVIAAYNCGERNVNKAIIRSGGKKNFWEIRKYLPLETRGYVPAFIAVAYVMNYASDYNIPVTPPAISYFETDTITVTQQVSLDKIASVIDVSPELLQYLNPVFKKKFIPSSGDNTDTYKIVLPSNKTASFLGNVDKIYFARQDSSSVDSLNLFEYTTTEVKKIYTVKRGEGIAAVAKKHDCDISDLKQWNKIKGNRVYPGQKIVVYVTVVQKTLRDSSLVKTAKETVKNSDTVAVKNNSDSSQTVAVVKPEAGKTTKDTQYIYHIVQPGDTLFSIARKYQATVQQLREINKIKSPSNLIPGTKLKIIVNG